MNLNHHIFCKSLVLKNNPLAHALDATEESFAAAGTFAVRYAELEHVTVCPYDSILYHEQDALHHHQIVRKTCQIFFFNHSRLSAELKNIFILCYTFRAPFASCNTHDLPTRTRQNVRYPPRLRHSRSPPERGP